MADGSIGVDEAGPTDRTSFIGMLVGFGRSAACCRYPDRIRRSDDLLRRDGVARPERRARPLLGGPNLAGDAARPDPDL